MPLRPRFYLLGAASAAVLTLTSVWLARASSTEPSGINIGGSSFNDGFGELTPGWVYQQYFQYEHFNAINNASGHAIGSPMFDNQVIDAVVSLNQIIYNTSFHLVGGTVGVNTVLPLIDLTAHNNEPALVTLKANGFGPGDLTWGPFLQMPPFTSYGRPVFSQRFEFDVISPIGTYSETADINQSSGFWSIAPYWAFTVLPAPKFEISARLYYLYNFTNNHPSGSGSPATIPNNFQAGQAVWANFAASYTIAPGLD